MNNSTIQNISELLQDIQIIGNKIYNKNYDEITPERIVFLASEQNIPTKLVDAKIIICAILTRLLLPNTKRYIKKVNHPIIGAPNNIKCLTKWKTTTKKPLESLIYESPFADEISKSRAIALMITPFIHTPGIKPIGIFLGNRERIGKDYLAQIIRALANDLYGELPPLDKDDETRKTLLALALANEEFAHFSNNVGHMHSPSLEQAVTSRVLKGRILGKSEVTSIPFNIIVSLSGNAGWSLTPDLTHRSIIVALHSDEEDILEKEYTSSPILEINQNKEKYWNTMKQMYNVWVEKGKPKGSINHATFPEWANIIGGIMEANGYINPLTKSDAGVISSLIDRDGQEWKLLLPILYDHLIVKRVSEGLSTKDIIQIVQTKELFEFFDFTKHGYRTVFGKLVKKYVGRWFEVKIMLPGKPLKITKCRLTKVGTELIGTNTGKQMYSCELEGVD